MMKTLFIFPPFYSRLSISLGIPQILGYLKSKQYDVRALDLNIKFYNYLYNTEVLLKLSSEMQKLYEDTKSSGNIPNTKHYSFLRDYFEDKRLVERNKTFIKNIDDFVKIFKSPKKSSNLFIQQRTTAVFESIQKLIDLLFHDRYTYDDYEYFVERISPEVYINFARSAADSIITEDYDSIAFSVNGSAQAIASLILSKILREKGYKGKIGMGGTNIFRDKKFLLKDNRYFKKYIDFVIFAQGELSTEEYFEYLEGKRDISKVSNILYMAEDGSIKETEEKYMSLQDIVLPDYEGYDLAEYHAAEKILPIRASYGCYWGKCTFCVYYYDNEHFCMRTAESVINEIKEYINKYDVRNFYFVDSCLTVKFLDEFATKIISERLEIYFVMQNRLEDAITEDLTKKLYKAGLRVCAWGLESASPKILKKMNKGINVESAKRILKDSNNAGIYNVVYWMYGFPGETDKDFEMTYNFLKDNQKNIHVSIYSPFTLTPFTKMYSDYEEFGIEKEAVEKLQKENPCIEYMLGHLIGLIPSIKTKERIQELKELFFNRYHTSKGTLETLLLFAKRNNVKYLDKKYEFSKFIEMLKYKFTNKRNKL